jgi:hypothetical protein
VFQPSPGLTSSPDPVLKVGDDPGRYCCRPVLVDLAGRHLEDGLADDVPHIGRYHHPHEPAVSLLHKIGVPRPDH